MYICTLHLHKLDTHMYNVQKEYLHVQCTCMIMYILCSAFSLIHVILSEPVLSNATKEGYATVWYQI